MKKIIQFSFIGIILFYANSLIAGGFQANLQGTTALGLGHSGTGIKLGASSVFFNPGAMALLDSNYASLSANFVIPRIDYIGIAPSSYATSAVRNIGTPFSVYTAIRLKKESRWNLGLAIYTPFGSGIQYEDNWLGQFVIRQMALRTIYYQPTIGVKISEKLGIGLGYVYGTGSFTLRKGIPLQDTNGNYGEARLTGSGAGSSFNIGVYYNPIEKLNIGISYRHSLKVKVTDGTAEFDVVPYLKDSFADGAFSTQITMPSVFNFGASYLITEQLTAVIDFNYVNWKVYDTLAIDFEKNSEILEDINSPKMFKPSYILRGGLQYKMKQPITIRIGAYYDKTPVQDAYLSPETPDSDKLGITAGGSFVIANKIEINAALLYVSGKKRTAVNQETQFGGTYKITAFVPSIGLQYIF